MIDCTTLRADPASCDSFTQSVKFYFKREYTLYMLSCGFFNLFECLCLYKSTREAIQQISFLTVLLFQSVFYHSVDDIIRNKFSGIHIGFSLFAKLCMISDIFSQHVTGRNMRNIILSEDAFGHCALTCTRRTHNKNVHNVSPPLN